MSLCTLQLQISINFRCLHESVPYSNINASLHTHELEIQSDIMFMKIEKNCGPTKSSLVLCASAMVVVEIRDSQIHNI